MEQTSRKEAGS